MSEHIHLEHDGSYPARTELGCYPIYYVCADGGNLCPKCANDNRQLIAEAAEYLDKQWQLAGQDVNWEDADLYCDNCNARIPSAYAEDEAEDCEANVEQIMEWQAYYDDRATEAANFPQED